MVSKMRISLMINGAEQLRIENEKYYICIEPMEDWFVMKQVDKSIFRKELEKYKWCENSWDKELSDKYKRIKEEVKIK